MCHDVLCICKIVQPDLLLIGEETSRAACPASCVCIGFDIFYQKNISINVITFYDMSDCSISVFFLSISVLITTHPLRKFRTEELNWNPHRCGSLTLSMGAHSLPWLLYIPLLGILYAPSFFSGKPNNRQKHVLRGGKFQTRRERHWVATELASNIRIETYWTLWHPRSQFCQSHTVNKAIWTSKKNYMVFSTNSICCITAKKTMVFSTYS